ncbi:hypothetical protein HK405_008637, partial [Cladochytrium tenue]
MSYEQRILTFNAQTLEFEYVYVKNGFRTHCDSTLVAISHLWPEPFADDNGRKQYSEEELRRFALSPKMHAHELYDFNSRDLNTAKGWVRERILQSVRAARALTRPGDEKVLIWLDVVSINQGNQLDIRDATYAMSIVYHIADITAVLIHDVYSGKGHWHQRRWTLQELELSHWIAFFYVHTGKISEPERVDSKTWALDEAIARSSRRYSRYAQDLIYSVRGLVPALFELPAVYDVSLDELVARAALIAARRGDYSMLRVNADPNQPLGHRMIKKFDRTLVANADEPP